MRRFRLTAFAILFIAAAFSGCARGEFTPVPNIPVAYYACLESKPQDLVALYTVHYNNIYASQVMYNDRVFVFKDIEATGPMLSHTDKGYTWILDIKFLLADDELARYKPGEKFDIVGLNTGINRDQEVPFCLLFKDCYVLPPGAVKLPIEGGGVVAGGY